MTSQRSNIATRIHHHLGQLFIKHFSDYVSLLTDLTNPKKRKHCKYLIGYKAGNADLKAGLLISLGFLLGGYFGGVWAQQIPEVALRRVFGILVVTVGIKLLLGK